MRKIECSTLSLVLVRGYPNEEGPEVSYSFYCDVISMKPAIPIMLLLLPSNHLKPDSISAPFLVNLWSVYSNFHFYLTKSSSLEKEAS